MNKDEPVKLTALVKFGDREHMTAFREEGLVFCNPLAYFRSLDADGVRRDKRDGISASYLAKNITITISNSAGETTLTHENGLVGRIDTNYGSPEPNVFCMYALLTEDIPFKADPRIYNFGNYCVFITDWVQFNSRLISGIREAGFELQTGLVEYVDNESFSGELGVFRKFSEFAFQKELRFAIDPGSSDPIEIRIGSIADISHQFDIDLNSNIEVR